MFKVIAENTNTNKFEIVTDKLTDAVKIYYSLFDRFKSVTLLYNDNIFYRRSK